ncbi:uncharacterized protein LOC111074144 [Drosophila obscura]|uniref:uncharacterized protein LOC111074144 n=1 Tax=Drosophila obscura TaxID=7282 RepID=UPI001BB2912F|nr:uncharacterized protein LOC111074144 [Drosophila obscura]
MSNVGKIRLKSIVELQATTNINVAVEKSVKPSVDVGEKTPEKKNPGKTSTGATGKNGATKGKTKSEVIHEDAFIIANATFNKRSSKKTPLPGQLRIDSFFKSSAKSFKVERLQTYPSGKTGIPKTSKNKQDRKSQKTRKRLFEEEATTSTTSTNLSVMEPLTKRVQPPRKARGKENVIDLCSESDEDSGDMKSIKLEPPPDKSSKAARIMNEPCPPSPMVSVRLVNDPCPPSPMVSIGSELILGDISIKENLLSQPSSIAATMVSHESRRSNALSNLNVGTSLEGNVSPVSATSEIANRGAALASVTPPSPKPNEIAAIAAPLPVPIETGNARKKRAPKPCPPYKVVEGTNFCVDGFQFGAIPGVTHYFLTHYHADHYIGLTKKFAFPLFMSPTTARLVRAFIKLDEMYIHQIDVDETIVVDDIEVTGIEANHCPGALMFLFRLPSGECILHTGDFRASFEMESLPIFWNNIDIDLLYLDTTYLSANYDFCHQAESVERALHLVTKFHERYPGKRVLYVCGSYVIGKEKIWLALANEFSLKVWTEPHRRVAIDCLEWPDLQTRLTDVSYQANLHVLAMGKVSYLYLAEYFTQFEDQYDMLLAIRPSGWEKNSKPSFGKRISIIGIEYSEHSSYKELERFVRFLKPKRVISTVPVGGNLFVTGKVPLKWHQFKGRLSMMARGYQPSISTFMGTPKRNVLPSSRSGTEMALSPVDENESDHVTISSSTSEKDVTVNKRDETEEHQGDGDASKAAAHKRESPLKSKPSAGEAAILNRFTSDASDDWLADARIDS